jgi:predicted  nucleic acid-binding Zn-ribbon protein
MPHNEARLTRIEEKLDRLTDAMVSMARAEEKISSLNDDHNKMYERLNRLSAKLDDIEKKVDDNHRTVCIINKLVYAAVVAAVGTYVAHMWM